MMGRFFQREFGKIPQQVIVEIVSYSFDDIWCIHYSLVIHYMCIVWKISALPNYCNLMFFCCNMDNKSIFLLVSQYLYDIADVTTIACVF